MGMVTTITTSYQQATFSLDLYRANIATPHGYREGAGHQPLGSFEVVRPIARRGVSGVSAEHLHMAQVKEGSWCALIVDPNNPSRYLLDGFFAPNGSFVKLFDEQVLLHQPI